MLSELFSSIFSGVHAEEAKEEPEKNEQAAAEEPAAEAEAEAEEPEDPFPVIREACKESSACQGAAKHFTHCQEKVEAGKGTPGETCVEELMMHCADKCAAPKLFAQLK